MERTRIERAAGRLRRLGTTEGLSILACLALLVALEALGRRLPPEWSVPPVAAMAALAAAGLMRSTHGGGLRWPRRLATRVAAAVRRAVTSARELAIRGGADLRGRPALERAQPGLLLACAPLPWLAAACAAAAGDAPHRVLRALAGEAFLLHAFALVGLWVVALALVLGFAVLTLGGLHDLCFEPRRRRGSFRPEQEHATQIGIALSVTVVAFLAPPVALLAVAALGLLVGLACLSPALGPDLDLAWSAGPSDRVRSCSFLGTLALRLVLWGGIAAFCAAATLGPLAWTSGPMDPEASLLLTPLLGHLLAAWAAAAGLVGAALMALEVARPRLAFASAARSDLVLRLQEQPDPRTAAQLVAALRGTGHAVRFGRRDRRAGDVRVSLRTALRLAFAASGNRLDEADVRSLRHRLARRSERLHRRLMLRALARVLDAAARESPDAAEGLWLGPQHWFERAATAPTDDDSNRARAFDADVGPPYATLLDWRTRVHWAQLCGRLEIDHLFVERGLTAAALVGALELLFEVDDVFGGRTRLEERHLRGLAGVRALIHEWPGEGSWSPNGYPEPSYEELARARVLHLFTDRGGDAERLELEAPRRSRPLSPRLG